MPETIVRLGNLAPTLTVREEVSEEEAKAAGPLASKELRADGSEVFYALKQVPAEIERSITAFVVPEGYSPIDACKDIGLAFGAQHSLKAPEWLHCADEAFGKLLAGHLGSLHKTTVPVLGDEEAEHLILGTPKPDVPSAAGPLPPIAGGAIQASGRDLWAASLGDMTSAAGTTSSAPTGTTATDSTQAWTTNQWAGHDVMVGSVVGTVLSNSATVLTVARWETPGSRSGAAAATPASGVYQIGAGNCPAVWVALTANNATPTTGGADTTLTGEITTAGGGLVRKVIVYGHTAGTNTYTLTGTYTANGTDVLPVTVAKVGDFQAQNGGRLMYETLFASTVTLSASGDNFQLTDTITGT